MVLQIMLATDDNEVCSGSFSRGIFPLPSQYLVTEMIYVRISLLHTVFIKALSKEASGVCLTCTMHLE